MIPVPIFFGHIIDQSCVLKYGDCLYYDNFAMALGMALTCDVVKILGIGCFGLGLALYFSNR